MFVTLMSQAQESISLEMVRSEFQEIASEEDIDKILALDAQEAGKNEQQMIKAYQATAICMMANYVVSPLTKLKYFKEGKQKLENLIMIKKDVENVYLRLLLQLNVPRMLNYHKNIEKDVAYLDVNLAEAPIADAYKYTMIKNLVGITEEKKLKDLLLQIDVVEES